MNHPSPEDWMTFLYGEDEPVRHAALAAHLRECAECAVRVNAWRDGIQLLDRWPTSLPARPSMARQPIFKWAAAAALMIGVGFFAGRAIQRPSLDTVALKAELARDFEERAAASAGELRRLLAEFSEAQEARRGVDQQAIIAALQQLDAKYAVNLAELREELETVAMNTQDGLLATHQQLGLLASASSTPTPEHK